jgi:hypothetical protein
MGNVMGAYAECGERLIQRGFAAIPIMPNTKRPGYLFAGIWIGLSNWQRRFNSGPPPGIERTRWGAGDAGLGVIGGYNGLIGVDIDTDDVAIRAALMKILPPSPVRKAGQKGETLFYYGPEITKSQSWDINKRRVVDLIGPGRQTVLPPTIHPDTKQPYRWSGTSTLDDLAPEDLPELPPDIAERITAVLTPFGYRPEPPPHEGSSATGGFDGDNPYRQLNDLALADLAAWVPALGLYRCRPARGGYEAVPMWRPSTTGRPPGKRHLNLKIVSEGIRDFGADQGYTPLDLVMAADGCDLDTAFRWLSERLGFGVDIDVSGLIANSADRADAKIDIKVDIKSDDIKIDIKAKPDPKEPMEPEPKAPIEPADELEPFTHVPGLVGDIVDYIVATARRPNPVLALGAAITVVGTLIGRRVAGPTRSATHLYVVPIAPSGAGKQHVLDAAMRLMHAAKAEGHIGPSKFFSLSAVQKLLQDKPLVLCLQDEIGVFLSSVTSAKAGNHEKAVSQMLRTLWGISFATVPTAQWASRQMNMISCPALSIFGVSTPDEFYAALQGENVLNGFLNRFLPLTSTVRADDTDPQLDPGNVPARLSDGLNRLYLWSGPESLLHIANPEISFTPDILPWASQQARTCYFDFTRMVTQHTDDHPDSAPYIARCVETSIRLATIRAAGRWGRGASVDLSDMEWGAGVAWTVGRALVEAAQEFVAPNERSEQMAKILAYVRRRSPVKPRDIQQFLKGRLRTREIKDILAQLVEAGEIEWTDQGYQPA